MVKVWGGAVLELNDGQSLGGGGGGGLYAIITERIETSNLVKFY